MCTRVLGSDFVFVFSQYTVVRINFLQQNKWHPVAMFTQKHCVGATNFASSDGQDHPNSTYILFGPVYPHLAQCTSVCAELLLDPCWLIPASDRAPVLRYTSLSVCGKRVGKLENQFINVCMLLINVWMFGSTPQQGSYYREMQILHLPLAI